MAPARSPRADDLNPTNTGRDIARGPFDTAPDASLAVGGLSFFWDKDAANAQVRRSAGSGRGKHSGPIPTFASLDGTHPSKCRNQKDH